MEVISQSNEKKELEIKSETNRIISENNNFLDENKDDNTAKIFAGLTNPGLEQYEIKNSETQQQPNQITIKIDDKPEIEIDKSTDINKNLEQNFSKLVQNAAEGYSNLIERGKYIQNEISKDIQGKWNVCIFPDGYGIAYTVYDVGYLFKCTYKGYHYKIYRHGDEKPNIIPEKK